MKSKAGVRREGKGNSPAWRCKANDVILKTILGKHFTPGIIFSRLLRKCTDYTRRQRYCSREEIKRNKTLGNLSSDCFARNPPRERTARTSWHACELLDTLFARKCSLHVDSTLNSGRFLIWLQIVAKIRIQLREKLGTLFTHRIFLVNLNDKYFITLTTNYNFVVFVSRRSKKNFHQLRIYRITSTNYFRTILSLLEMIIATLT